MVVEVNSTLKRVTQDGAARTCNKANEIKKKPQATGVEVH